MRVRLLTLLVLSASLAAKAPAQSIGRVAGTVTDNTGAAVTEAAVEVVNLETGEVRQRDDERVRHIRRVAASGRQLSRCSIRKEGFKVATRNDVRVDVNRRPPSTYGSRSET